MSKILIVLALLFAVNSFASGNANISQTKIQRQTTPALSTSSALVLAANPDRKYLVIQNTSAISVYVKFGSAHSGTEGVLITAGGNYEPNEVPTDSVYAKSASGTPTLNIVEGN